MIKQMLKLCAREGTECPCSAKTMASLQEQKHICAGMRCGVIDA